MSGHARATAAVRLDTGNCRRCFQVLADGSLGYTKSAGYLGIGVPGGDQSQRVPVPGGDLGRADAALLGFQVGLMQVGAQQYQQHAVPLGEVPSSAAWPGQLPPNRAHRGLRSHIGGRITPITNHTGNAGHSGLWKPPRSHL
jgi:hypothetical protein